MVSRQTTDKNSIETLRRQVDHIDDAIHDLLMERCAVVERIGDLKNGANLTFLSPGREAEIIRRLLSRHLGRFPRASLVRLWRELISGMLCVQGPMSVAVYMPERGAGYLELARDHYGSSTPMTAFRSAGQVVHAVAEGNATVGVLPIPDRDDVEAWWMSLMSDTPDLPRIVSRLPFAGPGPGRGDNKDALSISRASIVATGYDRSWLALETVRDISRARLRTLLGAAGIEPVDMVATQRGDDTWLHLVEISGHVAAEDRRLNRLAEGRHTVLHARVLGGYPVPLTQEELAE
jgi:chorismate mutase